MQATLWILVPEQKQASTFAQNDTTCHDPPPRSSTLALCQSPLTTDTPPVSSHTGLVTRLRTFYAEQQSQPLAKSLQNANEVVLYVWESGMMMGT